ncbi:uncharacterized protein LOC119398846 [Rhipicephalus sanguineus]|uniref:uncharacterized protein LOC119398846 n=1 Tax=Rhipicephalus sanguineus TaxID=34632 RepID=UPI0020C4F95F|nr:uncharacterized protein LOC119398846 [Rhipicephalus sanguineus]
MWFSRAAKRRPGVCLVGLSPNFKKSATSELQVCSTRRIGDLRRVERSFNLAARPAFCTWTSRGFALKRYSSADVLTRPVALRLIFRTIADGCLHGGRAPGIGSRAPTVFTHPLDHNGRSPWRIFSRHYFNSTVFVPPGLATADEAIVKEFQRRQHIGDRRKGRRYCELQHRHQTKWQVSLLTRLTMVTVFSHDGSARNSFRFSEH